MTRIPATPKGLTCAREHVGLDVFVLAGRFPKLSAWEAGERQTTLRQLENFIRPLGDEHVVISHEVLANSMDSHEIPNTYIGLNLRFMTYCEMLRREGARSVLGARP